MFKLCDKIKLKLGSKGSFKWAMRKLDEGYEVRRVQKDKHITKYKLLGENVRISNTYESFISYVPLKYLHIKEEMKNDTMWYIADYNNLGDFR